MKFMLFSINLAVHYGLRTELNLNSMVKLAKGGRVKAASGEWVVEVEHTTNSN